jgi:hypothetical protein
MIVSAPDAVAAAPLAAAPRNRRYYWRRGKLDRITEEKLAPEADEPRAIAAREADVAATGERPTSRLLGERRPLGSCAARPCRLATVRLPKPCASALSTRLAAGALVPLRGTSSADENEQRTDAPGLRANYWVADGRDGCRGVPWTPRGPARVGRGALRRARLATHEGGCRVPRPPSGSAYPNLGERDRPC